MYRPAGYMGGAGARYRSVDVASRLEGASPHRLVQVLFEELLKAIDTMLAAQRMGQAARRSERQSRALSILHALETSLDFENGGEIAANLASIYREARRLITAGGRDGQPAPVEQARAILAEIAGAWDEIR